MSILDNEKIIKKFDSRGVLVSLGKLNAQCQQAWTEANKINLPVSYKQIKNIVAAGMGGSTLGAHIVKSVFEKELKIPFEITNHYFLPAYVNKDSLVFLLSYSGNTEETLSAAQQATAKKAKVIVITNGGKLANLARKHNWPAYIFLPRHNPSGQPRLGVGYLLAGMIAFLNNLSLIKSPSPPLFERGEAGAKKMAMALQNKEIILVGSEHLTGNLHAFANQINENAKQFACYFLLPEMNHHLMEGLSFPKENKNRLKFLFFESTLFHPRVMTRYSLTKEVLKKQNIQSLAWRPKTKTRLGQALEMLAFGGFISFYLAVLNKIDPSKIPWVDYFKKKLH
ncbi:MAG: SIS domain-containing protein [bacterium]|nr:SIS domain-containing protein [bacterium]